MSEMTCCKLPALKSTKCLSFKTADAWPVYNWDYRLSYPFFNSLQCPAGSYFSKLLGTMMLQDQFNSSTQREDYYAYFEWECCEPVF